MRSPYQLPALMLTLSLPASAATMAEDAVPVQRWSAEKANQWYKAPPWPVGRNYILSTAVNQIETWPAESFDPKTIDRVADRLSRRYRQADDHQLDEPLVLRLGRRRQR
jgi:hypothetical protein